jgi:Xaa-Pro aminopeptidase
VTEVRTMRNAETTPLRRALFSEKRAQLEGLLEVPLLLFWGKWDSPNIRALTLAEEFTRPTFVLCEPGGKTTALVQRIETDQLAGLAGDVETVPYVTISELKEALRARLSGWDEVTAEASTDFFALDRLPPAFYDMISSIARVRRCDDVLVPFRAVKSPAELRLLKNASEATMATFAAVGEMVVPGVAEGEILDFLLHRAIEAGGEPAFAPIVASGPRSRNPHPQRRTERKVEAGDRVIVDYGISICGYRADVTRTYVAGASPEDDPYYDLSVELVRILRDADLGNMTPLELGRRVASAVAQAGFADRERHGYGHGLGAETHDPHPYIGAHVMPWLDRPFADGMVFTFEPGFYDERGGFRLEDDYVVRGGRAVAMQDFEPPAGGGF